MQKSLIAVLIASAFLSINAQAADLIQVYQQALANDATFASARASLAVGKERVPQGRASLLPIVGFTGSFALGESDASPDRSRTNINTLTLSQPLFRWANWQTYQQSKLLQSISEAQFAQAQQDLITRTSQAYFDVLAAEDAVELNRAQKTATTEQLASAKRNFEVGTQTITDTHEAQAAYDLVVAQEFAAINDLENKRSALQNIIGKAPGPLAPLKPGVVLATPSPALIDPWVASAETQNYAVVSAELSYESSKRDIQRNRAGHYPTLDLVANASRRSDSINNITSSGTTKAIGVQYAIPIFSGFSVNSKVRESIALEDKARNDLEASRRVAAQNARQAFLGVNSGLAQVRALQAAEVSSTSALESNKLGYQVGVRINIDVLNAQRQLYQTRTNLSRARYDTIINGLRLKAAAGSLREADLIPVNNLLVK
ncbi:MAG: TolC family outer membrane protein [Pseudomonadota bacterium]